MGACAPGVCAPEELGYRFIKIVVPLSVPAFASIFILQFLWVWNDLLVGLVFLDKHPSEIILTAKLKELLGTLIQA